MSHGPPPPPPFAMPRSQESMDQTPIIKTEQVLEKIMKRFDPSHLIRTHNTATFNGINWPVAAIPIGYPVFNVYAINIPASVMQGIEGSVRLGSVDRSTVSGRAMHALLDFFFRSMSHGSGFGREELRRIKQRQLFQDKARALCAGLGDEDDEEEDDDDDDDDDDEDMTNHGRGKRRRKGRSSKKKKKRKRSKRFQVDKMEIEAEVEKALAETRDGRFSFVPLCPIREIGMTPALDRHDPLLFDHDDSSSRMPQIATQAFGGPSLSPPPSSSEGSLLSRQSGGSWNQHYDSCGGGDGGNDSMDQEIRDLISLPWYTLVVETLFNGESSRVGYRLLFYVHYKEHDLASNMLRVMASNIANASIPKNIKYVMQRRSINADLLRRASSGRRYNPVLNVQNNGNSRLFGHHHHHHAPFNPSRGETSCRFFLILAFGVMGRRRF